MELLKITQIFTQEIVENAWIAKTTFFSPAKTDIEIKGDSEQDAYQKIIDLLQINKKPNLIQESKNGNKIYNF